MAERRPGVDRIGAVLVVVPAHDEETLLGRCLESLDAAVADLRCQRPDVVARVVVVLDDCGDASAAVAARHDVETVAIQERCVGAARSVGVARAVELIGAGWAASTIWLATTDADSEVPRDWLVHQVRVAEAGSDLVLGRVRPDPRDLDQLGDDVRRAWGRAHQSVEPTAHVHGANLGARCDHYEAAGGFPLVPEHEDVLLVDALLAGGARVGSGSEVLTSGRRDGRVAGGFSGYLRQLVADTQRG